MQDSLVQLPDPAEFNQRARDTRVARIAGGPHVVERHDVRERPRADDLQAIVEHRDPDVVAPERVVAMGHRLFPLSSNTFPRSERLLLDPWSIRIFDSKIAGFQLQNRRKRHPESVDASEVRFHSFTSRKSIRPRYQLSQRSDRPSFTPRKTCLFRPFPPSPKNSSNINLGSRIA